MVGLSLSASPLASCAFVLKEFMQFPLRQTEVPFATKMLHLKILGELVSDC